MNDCARGSSPTGGIRLEDAVDVDSFHFRRKAPEAPLPPEPPSIPPPPPPQQEQQIKIINESPNHIEVSKEDFYKFVKNINYVLKVYLLFG